MDRRFIPIFAIVLVNFIGSTIVIPVLPLFTQEHFGAGPELISLLYGSFFIAQFIASPWLGRLSDEYGRLPVLIISQLGTAACFLLMGVAQTLPLMFAARILDGVTGGNVIVAQAYLTDITSKEERTRALGLTWAAFGIGLATGGFLGGVLASQFGERAPFFAGMIMSLFTVGLTVLFLDETLPKSVRMERRLHHHPRLSLREVLQNRILVLILTVGFIAQLAMMLFQSSFALYSEHVLFASSPLSEVTFWAGVLLALHGVWQFLTQFLLMRAMLSRFGERWLVLIGAAIRGLALLSFVLLPYPLAVALLGMIGFAIGSGLMMPSLQSLATTSTHPEVSGAVLGVYQSSVSLGVISGSLLSGFLFAQSPFLPFLIGGLLLLLSMLPSYVLVRRKTAPLASPV